METQQHLFINTDGGSRGNPGTAGAGVSVSNAGGELFGLHKYLGVMTNNEAEYEAVIFSLDWLLEQKNTVQIERITWRLDSKLVVEQLSRRWKIKEARLRSKAQSCWDKIAQLGITAQFQHIPREQNSRADELANLAMDEQS